MKNYFQNDPEASEEGLAELKIYVDDNGEITFNPGIGEECFIPISGRFISHQISL